MSIKKLINALFQMSGSRAMPNGDLRINIPIEPSNSKITFVAPDNGFIRLRALGNVEALEIDSNNQYGVLSGIKGNAISNNALFLPVKKGDIVGLLMRPQTDSEISSDRSCTFYHLVGGAKRLLAMAQSWIRGGALCLLTSSIQSARYLSCRALKRCRAVRTLTLICRRVDNGHNYIQQVLMGMLNCLAFTLLQLSYQTLRQQLGQKARQLCQQVVSCQSKKETSSTSTLSIQAQKPHGSGLLKPSVLLSLCKEVCHG